MTMTLNKMKIRNLTKVVTSERAERMLWKWTVVILCCVGLLKEFRPSEPFLLDYAVEFRNFTAEQITHEILPVTTWGHIASLIGLLFVTDVLAYKPIIVLGGAISAASWAVTIWSYTSDFYAKLRQLLFAASVVCTELAYFTYMYSNVDKKYYQQVTSYTHSAVHTGRFLSGALGQILLSYHVLELDVLNYFSLTGVSMGLFVSIFLPKVTSRTKIIEILEKKTKLVFSPEKEEDDDSVTVADKCKSAFAIGLEHVMFAYSQFSVVKWSIWWALAFALHMQVELYAESLWKEIEEETHHHILNGAVSAAHALLSAISAIGVAFIKLPWKKFGHFYLSAVSIVQGVSLFLMSQVHSLYTSYGCYILFQTLWEVLVIIIRTAIAEDIQEGSEALIFGLNTLAALFVQLILTFVVTADVGFHLPIRQQYVVYSVYSALLGLIFLAVAIIRTKIKINAMNDASNNISIISNENSKAISDPNNSTNEANSKEEEKLKNEDENIIEKY